MKKSMKLFALILAVAMMLSLALPASATDATLPEGMEWMTPFDETVKLNVVVGWDADSGVKEGTTPETNSLVQLAKDFLNIELNFLWMVPNDQLSERLALQISSGEIPDIVMLESEYFYEFMDSDYLRDLTDAYENCGSREVALPPLTVGPYSANFTSISLTSSMLVGSSRPSAWSQS